MSQRKIKRKRKLNSVKSFSQLLKQELKKNKMLLYVDGKPVNGLKNIHFKNKSL
jgi:hypothetical protein